MLAERLQLRDTLTTQQYMMEAILTGQVLLTEEMIWLEHFNEDVPRFNHLNPGVPLSFQRLQLICLFQHFTEAQLQTLKYLVQPEVQVPLFCNCLCLAVCTTRVCNDLKSAYSGSDLHNICLREEKHVDKPSFSKL